MAAVTRSFTLAIVCGLVLLPLFSAHGQSAAFTRACQKWIEQKGYSTDYIEQKTGSRQPGLASEWRGNVPVQSVQPGDVILIKLNRDAMHAALVEELRTTNAGISGVRVSEWNWGRLTDSRCLITENFGKANDRWLTADSIAYVWRPSLPLKPR